MWCFRGQRQGEVFWRSLIRRRCHGITPGGPREVYTVSANLLRQPINLNQLMEKVSAKSKTTLKMFQGKVFCCRGPEGGHDDSVAVFLAEGCVVCWHTSEKQRKALLEIADDCPAGPKKRGFGYGRNSSLELFALSREGGNEISETLVFGNCDPGQKTKFNPEGMLALTVETQERMFDQVAVSLGMAVAVRLEGLEEKIERLLEKDWKDLEKLVRLLENPWYAMMSLRNVSHVIFKYEHMIHKLRYELNAEARLLDSPDLLWENAIAEKLHDKVVAHFDVRRRTEILNQRLSYSLDYVHTLGEHVRHLYSVRLERMIIILITLELGVGVMGLSAGVSPHGPSPFSFGKTT